MVKQIIWKPKADRTFDKITDYLTDNFSGQAAQNFATLVYEKIDRLTKQPLSGPEVPNRKTLRYVDFGKHYRMFYRVEGKKLIISNFFDTRQDPSKSPF